MDIEKVLKELTLEEKASLCSGDDFWHTKAVKRLGIDRWMMCDGPNGIRKQEEKADHLGINESIKAVCFPTASAVAASFDKKLARQIGECLGSECQAENITMLLGPGVNIKRSPLCGRNFEYYSEDPYQSSQMAAAFIQGVESKYVGACIKHFAANNQETRRGTGNSVVDERTLHEIYMASFEDAIKEGKPSGVMCAYNKVNGIYAAENKELLTEVLRNQWNYDGMVVTDWGAVKNRVTGIEAGLDLEMPGGGNAPNHDAQIVKAVKEGILSEEKLDECIKRILRFYEYSVEHRVLVDTPSIGQGMGTAAVFDREADYQQAKKAAEKCAVLLKNDRDALPLKKERRVAFVGGFVEKTRNQGSGSSHINSAKVPSLMELISNESNISYAKGFSLDTEENDNTLVQEAISLAAQSEETVLFAGLPNRFESEGVDRKHINLPQNQNYLIHEIAKITDDLVVVLYNGSPVAMPWIDEVSAILEMYLGGDGVSEATMNLLFGNVNPSGKLAETFPVKLEDNPSYLNFPGVNGEVHYHEGIFVGYRYYEKKKMPVLFPFGHGLSYTSFHYSDLQISKLIAKDIDEISVNVKITNVGSVAGAEVVQLYVGQMDAEVPRPVKELKGFEKIYLEPRESGEITFILGERTFAYYEECIHDWFVPEGTYEIMIGSSSADIRLTEKINVEATKYLPLTITKDTTIGELRNHSQAKAKAEDLIRQVIAGVAKSTALDAKSAAEIMGEGSEGMIANMIQEMSLGALQNHGGFSDEQMDGIIAMLSIE